MGQFVGFCPLVFRLLLGTTPSEVMLHLITSPAIKAATGIVTPTAKAIASIPRNTTID